MSFLIRAVHPLDDHRYEVTFEVDGAPTTIVCEVATHDGRPFVRPDHDVFMTGQAPARDLVSAVLDFHHSRLA